MTAHTLRNSARGRSIQRTMTTPEAQTAFKHQYTRDMLRMLMRRVTALVRYYERHLPRKSTDTAEDRIHAALTKLLACERIWDPSRVDLCGFLLGVVVSDLKKELRRAGLVPLVVPGPDAPPREDDYTGALPDDADAAIHDACPGLLAPASIDGAWSLAIVSLCECAADDASALALIGAWEQGMIHKHDVLAYLRWSASKYARVYHRVIRLAETLPPFVREAIRYALAD